MTKSIDGLVPVYVEPYMKKLLKELAELKEFKTFNEVIDYLVCMNSLAKNFIGHSDTLTSRIWFHGYKVREHPEVGGRGLIAGDKK